MTTGTHSLVKTGSGAVSADYLSVQHSIATPTRTWFAGSNSTNNQGTATAGSGWYFTPVPPSDTTGVSATITNRNIIISWTAPTTYIGGTSLADLATFSVYRDTDSSGSFTTQVGSQISSSTLSFTDPDPTIGTTLYYEVTSVNASGTESFKSSATTGVLLAESTVSAGGGGGTYAPASFVYESTALASAPAPTQPAPAPEPTPTPTSENLAPLYARISELQAQVALLMSGIASQASSPVPSAPSTGSGQASSQPPSSGTPTGTAGPAASTPSSVPVSSYFFPRTLRIADEGEDVKQLQIYLNTHGFLIAPDGPGSLDNETTIYGALTYDAISRFQEAYANELLVPLGLTKGYGYFGPLTRRYVNGG
ncbi:MAG: hypothetical protein A2946_00230 [Candidatus Liptonbacteria bacterium RIFCSPLOWO2_01_FULL_53_13]|uniref:Fibronectin type-III domain-containing protein n=1 Tax=Candidatus Liptonbacteria bacterium RIFCSPLOWO2_01_FULL_53_13 TaxID=1798651 RepID=A0A1G2CMQ0_9BACT|nr:MAG: hypothetical protein A2946_00230 [Candidatus Liptonbacteria bacterium RIFCSPLOWO2_01_FULL_53_13]